MRSSDFGLYTGSCSKKKSMYVQVFSEDTNGTFLQNFICKLFHMLKMLEQYIGNDGTHSLRAKLVWSLVTIKVPKRSYHVELLTDIWSNKYKMKRRHWCSKPKLMKIWSLWLTRHHHGVADVEAESCHSWSKLRNWVLLKVPTPSLQWLKWISFKSCCCSSSLWCACWLHLGN